MGARPSRAVGSYGLLDVIRQRQRLSQRPPQPGESLTDVRAVQSGEIRRVWCWLREPRGDRWRGPRQGSLDLSGTNASWRPWPSLGIRKARDLDVRSVVLVRPAKHSDQRSGNPGNLHLFSLVRCWTPAGRLDLLVPTADVPLVTWCLGGKVQALAHAPVPSMNKREVRLRAAWGLGLFAIGVLAMATRHGALGIIPMNFGALLIGTAALGQRRARRNAERSATADH